MLAAGSDKQRQMEGYEVTGPEPLGIPAQEPPSSASEKRS